MRNMQRGREKHSPAAVWCEKERERENLGVWYRQEDNIYMDLTEIVWQDVDCFHQWQAGMYMGMNVCIS